eukprot:TRINITY_DN111241_c0_g1_i1.p1 TRINITY_DN111241_c0_g1~~TRINITY_DN111241_c0_g1_i1.p1  ORF type:complete len:297 (-),score=29.38 TRINITY_DN111241_c0_g1_i1:267-1157(-)
MCFPTSAAETCAVVAAPRTPDSGTCCDHGGVDCFEVEVFSVEDACGKGVGGAFASMTLAGLVANIRYEFAVDKTDEVTLLVNDRKLEERDMPRTLKDLGISAGASLAFASCEQRAVSGQTTAVPQQSKAGARTLTQARRTAGFSVEVSSMTGEAFDVPDLLPSTSWGSFIEIVETMMGLEGDESVTLINESADLSSVAAHQTLKKAGIHAGSRLTSCIQLGARRACPQCKSKRGLYSVLHDVMIGATHEGWGRKWNTCEYSCLKCRVPILSGESVNACNVCRGFWHRSCRVAACCQ